MARLPARDYHSKRERIKQQATPLFAKNGFHGTSIIDIAKVCHTVKSRLYYYFPSKQQLLFEIIYGHAEFIAESLLPIFARQDLDAQCKLALYAQTLHALNIDHRDQHKLILGELDKLNPEQERQVRQILRRTINGLIPVLTSMKPELMTQKHVQFPTAMMFVGMINWSHTWFDGSGQMPSETYAKLVCKVFLDGFLSPS